MRRAGAWILVAVSSVAAGSFADRYDEANTLLESGDAAAALGIYRDLQIDDPESKALYYGSGCAQYEQGVNKLAAEAADEAIELFEAAESAFQKAALSPSPRLRRDAAYNLTNATAQLAKLSLFSGDYEGAVEAFEDAIKKYEDFLARYPDHQKARNNLAHMRFYLKKMMQNPPQPQEQRGESGENEKQEQQQDESKQNEGEDEQQPEEQEQQESREQEQQQQEDTAQADVTAAEESDPKQEQPEPEQRQNIEAILQSLEDQDNREQHDIKDRQPGSRVVAEWW